MGEPGSFILQKSREAAAQVQAQSQAAVKSAVVAKPSAPPTPAPIPAPIKTEGLPAEVRKGKAGEKTPVTPGTGGKKRKKSKVVVGGEK